MATCWVLKEWELEKFNSSVQEPDRNTAHHLDTCSDCYKRYCEVIGDPFQDHIDDIETEFIDMVERAYYNISGYLNEYIEDEGYGGSQEEIRAERENYIWWRLTREFWPAYNRGEYGWV